MIDDYYYRPLTSRGPEQTPEMPVSDPKKRGSFMKRLLLLLFILVLLAAILLVAAYFYVRHTPLGNTDGRTNIAIIGVDDTAKLSDSLMVVSIDKADTAEPRAAVVSIPRDMYVPIPEHGWAKINAAYAFGENMDYPGGGAALTKATLEENLGIPIHYYATLDFTGFEEVIDTLGGVTIDVKRSIDDPFYPARGGGGYDPYSVSKGIHQMDGVEALKYVRSRQTTNDFDRAFRQQQVVLAVKNKVMNTELLLDRRAVSDLILVVDNHVDTNFNRLDFLKLASVIRALNTDNVPQYVIDTSNLLVGTVNETGSALVPRAGDFSEVKHFMRNVFDQNEVDKFEQLQF